MDYSGEILFCLCDDEPYFVFWSVLLLRRQTCKGPSHKQGSQFRMPSGWTQYLISSPHVEIRNLTKYVIEMNSVSLRVATGLVRDISSLI